MAGVILNRPLSAEKNRLQSVILGILLLYLLMGGTVTGVLYLAAVNANEQSVTESKREVAGYLRERSGNLESQVLIYAYWQDGIDNLIGKVNTQWADVEMGEYLLNDVGIDLWFVLDPQADITFAKRDVEYINPAELAVAAGDLQQILSGARGSIGPPPDPASSYIQIDGQTYLVAGSALITESRPFATAETWVLAFARPMVDGIFEDIAANQAVELAIVDRPSTKPGILSLPLTGSQGETLAWVQWQIELAGNRLLAFVAPWVILVFALTLALSGFLLLRISRMHEEKQLSENRFRDAIEALPDGFVVYDRHDRLAICNERYRELYPLSAPAIVRGHSFEQILRFGYEQGQYRLGTAGEEPETRKKYLADRLAKHRKPSGAFEQCLSDGRWIRVVERAMSDGGVVSFRADISEIKQREADLLAARQAAESANQAKSRFLATVSHEVRTPLNAVIGFLELLHETEHDETAQRHINIALRSGEHLLTIIDNLLDFSRMEAGQFELEHRRFSPSHLVDNVCQMLQPMAAQRGIALLARHSQVSQEVLGDESKLRQVLLNLACNALKFTDKGSVTLQVESSTTDPEHCRLDFAIEDTGIGLDAEQIKAAFEPFNQVHDPLLQTSAGVGLGLPISQCILEAMNSELEVTSVKGQGSSFFFRLDLGVTGADKQADTAREPIEMVRTVAKPLPPIARVLIADDVNANRMLLGAMLSGSGYETSFASNGRDVLELLRTRHHDLVLMDISMPEMDGVEATQHLRVEIGDTETPIIALTANAMKGDRERFLAAGMNDYLSKPIRKTALMDLLAIWAPIEGNAPSP